MLFFVFVYLAGALTIVSPCILPVLPFVFARADRPFLRGGLPLLVGMAATFAAVATLAAVGGGWAVRANQYGRLVSIALLALFGVALLWPTLGTRMMNPLVTFGARLSRAADRGGGPAADSTVAGSLLLGVATGLLWAPCAGPVLGLLLTGAALGGASAHTTLLLLAYAAGVATSLAAALLAGGRLFAALKRSLGVTEWIRRGLGVAVLGAVVVIALGLDTGFLTRVSLSGTAPLEQRLLDKLGPAAKAPPAHPPATSPAGELPVEGSMPPLAGAVAWLNSPPLTAAGLRGKVVVVDFWTYSCINCLRALPYVRAWADKYKDQGLVVIGVHTPEFAFEKDLANVRKAVADLGVSYPVAVDNDYAIWRAFGNSFWPAHYFVDAQGRIRHHHFGEGEYDVAESVIQRLLLEAGAKPAAVSAGAAPVRVTATGAEAAADVAERGSPETYVGYGRAQRFVSPGGAVRDRPHGYAAGTPRLNEWELTGDWTIGREQATLDAPQGQLIYRFHARDLHLVLGPAADGKPVRFQVTIDGAPPGANHGADCDARGQGAVDAQRLYQLIRQVGTITDHTFEIRFLGPGVQVYAFTFG